MEKTIRKELPGQESSDEQIVAQEAGIVNDYDIDAFLSKRKEFIEKVNAIMVEGSDYHVIQGKKSLAKGGAEKIASIFGWSATFEKDQAVIEAFSELKGVVAFICNLAKGVQVGQGRGASSLYANKGDPNKTIKMAQKSAFIDAVLRTSGLSDFFTQDLGPEDEGARYNHLNEVPKATDKQKKFIADLMEQKHYTLEDLADNGITPGQTPPNEVIDFLKNVGVSSGTPFDDLTPKANDDIPDLSSPEVPIDSPAKAKLREKMGRIK